MFRKKVSLFFCLFVFGSIIKGYTQIADTIFLNKDWRFTEQGAEIWLPANVPGTVHTDLFVNKKIPDPFYGCNEKDLQWIETKNWEYKTAFTIDEATLKNKHIELIAEGLDTYAKVYVNNHLIISANNMFRLWNTDCKDNLHSGTNEIRIVFESPVVKGKEAATKLSYTLPGDEKVFVRKAQYQFGWDWGPRFVTCGIWKPIYLRTWNDYSLDDVQFIQHELNKNEAKLSIASTFRSDNSETATLKITDANSGIVYATKSITLPKGINSALLDFSIKNPTLWWTHDLGIPYLYHFNVEVIVNKKTIAQRSLSVGLRTIEVVNEKDKYGESFYFKLNGIPIFIKGSNYIPQDNFLPRVTTQNYDDLLNMARKSNMNMLRVWGGGIYENDIFYNLCDAKGILVWQDFMFACAMYPGDSAFLNNVTIEASQQVKRLRNHPCLALWCGNNEIDEGWKNWGWQKQYNYSLADSSEIWNNYVSLFNKILPKTIRENDSQRFYWQSSPKYGWGRTQSITDGDSHYWGVWWGMEPFEMYRQKTGRFASEYGFQGFPERSTLDKFSIKEDSYLYSEAMKCHEKHPTGYETIKTYMLREYNEPKDLDDYIYVSQLLQAYGMKTAIEAHRNAKPRCMGTLYWQFNDCWPVVSWSGTDYNHNPKALQYFVRNGFKNILVTFTNNYKTIDVEVISDSLNDVNAQLELKLMNFAGTILWQQTKRLRIKANSSQIIDTLNKTSLLPDTSQFKSLLLSAKILVNNIAITDNILYFNVAKNLALENPEITYDVDSIANGYTININTHKLAKNIFISFEGLEGKGVSLSDNFFDLLPNSTVKIIATTKGPFKLLKEKIKVRSLFDVK